MSGIYSCLGTLDHVFKRDKERARERERSQYNDIA
jgi:hypothetical protein